MRGSKADLNKTITAQAETILMLHEIVKSLRENQSELIGIAARANEYASKAMASNHLDEDVITFGRIFALQRMSHSFNIVFFEQLRNTVDDPRSLVIPSPFPNNFTHAQLAYACAYISLIAAKAFEGITLEPDEARDIMLQCFDGADNYIPTTEDLDAGVLMVGEDFYEDDDAEEPGAST